MNDINVINKYSVEEYLHKKIAPTYLNLDTNSNYRVGVYGYVNEVVATGTSMVASSLSELFTEIFPNTARMPESIMKYASLANVEGIYAKPSIMDIILVIDEDYIINRSRNYTDSSQDKFIIPKEVIINIEGNKFTLPDDIVISYKKDNTGTYIYSAYYNRYNSNASIVGTDNPYIKIMRVTENNKNVIYVYPSILQVERKLSSRYITSTNMLDNISHIISFTGQLYDFNVYYKKSPNSERELINKYIEGSNNIISNVKSCYYRLISLNEIEIQFESRSGFFKPEFNSEIIVEVFTTEGASGNFTYKGTDIKVKFPDELMDSSIPMTVMVLSDSTNGSDKLSLEELRTRVCDAFSKRDCIVIDSDLYKHYNSHNIAGTDKSKLRFVKYRDDIFKRLYIAYILLKDDEGKIIPTNSIDVALKPTDYHYTGDISSIFKSNSRLIYDPSIKAVVPYRADLDDDDKEYSYKFKYRNPYMIVTTKQPNTSIALIDYINDKYRHTYEYINPDSILQFICNGFKLYRNPDLNQAHEIRIAIQKSSIPHDIELGTKDKEGNITDLNVVKIYNTIYSGNVCLGYLQMTLVDLDKEAGIYYFKSDFTISNDMYSDSVMVYNTFFKPFVNTNEKVDVRMPYTDLNFKTSIFCKGDIVYNRAASHEINVPEGYSLINVYLNTQDKKVEILHNISDIIQLESKNNIVSYTDRTQYVRINTAPLIAEYYFNSIASKEYINKIMFDKRNIFNKAASHVIQNYSVVMKLYNTYGPSSFYTVGRTEKLDRVNISLNFNIRLSRSSALSKDDIIRFMSRYIEDLNTEEMSPMYVSKIIEATQNKFPDIQFIEFLNINQYPQRYQSIEPPVDQVNLEAGFVPEYINIHYIKSYQDFVPDIIINLL